MNMKDYLEGMLERNKSENVSPKKTMEKDDVEIVLEGLDEELSLEHSLEPSLPRIKKDLFEGYLGELSEAPNPLEYGANATYRNLREGIVYKKGPDNLWEVFVKDGTPGRPGQSAPGGGCGSQEVAKIVENRITSQPIVGNYLGSPSNPFATPTARNAAYSSQLPSIDEIVSVIINGVTVKTQWIGPTATDWVDISSVAHIDTSKIRMNVTVYDIQNDRWPRENLPQVDVEALVPPSAGSADILFDLNFGNGSPRFPIKRKSENTSGVQSSTVTVPLYHRGTKIVNIPINLVTTKLSSVPNTIFRPLFVGDSICATEFTGFDGTTKTGWGIASLCREFWVKDNVDGLSGNFVPMGHIGNSSGKSTDYRGSNYALRSFHEARGGWCATTWGNHPILLTSTTAASTVTNANGYASWDLCGFTTRKGRGYNASTTDANFIRAAKPTFAPGSYDYSQAVWDYLRLRSEWTGPQTAWVDNETNRGFIDTILAALVITPDNPFWSSSQAAAGFNPYNFTNRYKTLGANGTTRLVVGSTAGTLITSANLANIDVVDQPNFLIIELGENDRWFFPGDLALTVADLVAFRTRASATWAWMGANAPKIAFIFPRNTGKYNPYGDPKQPTKVMTTANAQWKYDLIEACKVAGLTVIDADVCANSASCANWSQQKYNTLDDGSVVTYGGYDGTHPGLDALRAIAFQVYAWMLSTVATP